MKVETADKTSSPLSVGLDEVKAAALRIARFVHTTPVMTNPHLDALARCRLFFKCENLQTAGAFKVRGAANAVLSLDAADLLNGVATHSSGNHAAALSYVAQQLHVSAHVVMPENASAAKVAAVRAYGGHITFCAPTIAARQATLDSVCKTTGALPIPPFDDLRIIAGQGTCALELVSQLALAPDSLVVPVGGGGLISGCGVVSAALWTATRVVGAEPAGAAYAAQSLALGALQPQVAPQTVADGLRAAPGGTNFSIMQRTVHAVHTVEDDAIVDAMRLLWMHLKVVVEPSAAVGLAVVLANARHFEGQRVCIVLSGGNVDIDALPWC